METRWAIVRLTYRTESWCTTTHRRRFATTRSNRLGSWKQSNIERCLKNLELLNGLLDKRLINFDTEKQNYSEKYGVTIVVGQNCGSIVRESNKHRFPRIQDIRGPADHSRVTQRSYANESISCATYFHKKSWGKDWKIKSRRFKVFTEMYRQHRIPWTVWMKPTSIWFNVSVLTKVLLQRHNPSAEKRNQQLVIYHKLEVTPSCSHEKITQCREQHPNWLQLRGTPPASNSAAPSEVPNSITLMTSSPTETTAPTVAVPEKPRQS